jgi:predicted flavoprotein YhiN
MLWGLFTTKVSGAICAIAKFPKDKKSGDLSKEDLTALVNILGHTVVPIDGTRGWNEAEFTAGGVDTDEIEHKTLASKKADGIHLAGELVNVDGQVGGFNLSWAWSSGWVAGKLQ